MTNSIGVGQDVVDLKLGGKRVLVAEGYDIQLSVLTQPAAFALRLGHGDVVRDLIKSAPPNTPFELRIDGNVQFVGKTDGYNASGTDVGSELTVRGRDALAPLHDDHLVSEQSFSDITYADLVKKGLDATVGTYTLVYSNDANRKAVTGNPKPTADRSAEGLAGLAVGAIAPGAFSSFAPKVLGTAVLVAAVGTNTEDVDPAPPGGGARTIQGKIGQRWYDGLIKAELDRAGLFLWAAADGSFILGAPDTKQDPSYRIFRKRGSSRNLVTVLEHQHKNDTAPRFSQCQVHFRAGSGHKSRATAYGGFDDVEVSDYGITRHLCLKDERCKTLAQSEFLARRKIAEARRNGWSLVYKVAGHTVVGINGTRLVWGADTIVEIDDDELGLKGPFYVEGVQFERNPQTTTTLHLMRPQDVLFGEPE